jgi:ABC-type polysaccharide/polyol phosphate export permease
VTTTRSPSARSSAPATTTRSAAGRTRPRDVWAARELLRNLVAKELKVRYKGSLLGFVWSLLSPLLITAIFTVVFAKFIRVPLADGDFASFFIAGYLAWTFFANSVTSSNTAIVGSGPLVKKVWFPRVVLPLSLVVSQGVHLGLALLATSPLIIWQRGFHPMALVPLVIGLGMLAVFTAGVSMLFAAANVYFRDLQELMPVLLLGWFYATPIIYPLAFVEAGEARAFLPLIQANPMTWFTEFFHHTLYGTAILGEEGTAGVGAGPAIPDLQAFLVCAAWALGALALGVLVFDRLSPSFAKEV